MSRRSAKTIEDAALAALLDALEPYGLHPVIVQNGPDLVIEVNGTQFIIEAKSIVTEAEAKRLVKAWRKRSTPTVLVAERISEDGRAALAAGGVNYLDRRGALRIVEPPLIIDTVAPSSTADYTSKTHPLSSQVAKEVSIACLLTPDQPHGVREVAGYIERAPSAVSKAMAELRDEGLMTSQNEPPIPDLFNDLVSLWRVRRVALAEAPPRGQAKRIRELGLGLENPEGTPGWALTDSVAAGSWGMPVVARGDYPPDFYVQSSSELQRARSSLGEAPDWNSRGCTVAVAPVRLACLRRFDHSRTSGEVWPVANHIVVALDLAQDKARGLEILDQWHPKDIVRAW